MIRLTGTKRRIASNSRRGATAVEFAITAPIFFMMIFVCFEFARLAMMSSLAEDAAYEAARYAMVEGSTTKDAKDKAKEVLALLGTQGATITVNDGIGLDENSAKVKIHISIPMSENSFVMSPFTSGNTVQAQITLTAERYNGFYSND